MNTDRLITVILPTHNHPETLDFSIQSILNQGVKNFNLVVIGDGVEQETRDIVNRYMALDNRISFMDKTKSKRHGESWRDVVIKNSLSPYIAYHGDDDLMLENHLATLLSEIGDADFIHTLPIQTGNDGTIRYLPTDLSNRDCIKWHLSEEIQNAVSLTGVMHTRKFYLGLKKGWEEAPIEFPSDLFMWRKFFTAKDFSGKTSCTSTTIKLDASMRSKLTAQARREEIASWWNRIREKEFSINWNQTTNEAVQRVSAIQFLRVQELERTIYSHKLECQGDPSSPGMGNEKIIELLNLELEIIKSSNSWKITYPIRVIGDALRKIFKN